MTKKTRRLQKAIIAGSALGLLALGTMIALVSLKPLYRYLKQEEERKLLVSAKNHSLAVKQWIDRARDVSFQISRRTKLRESLSAYNNGEITLAAYEYFNKAQLVDALNESVVGISRFDAKGNLVVQVGMPIPQSYWLLPTGKDEKSLITGPIKINQESYLVVSTSIVEQKRQGTNLTLFLVSNWQETIFDKSNLNELGETILGKTNGKYLQMLVPFPSPKADSTINNLRNSNAATQALRNASQGKEGALWGDRGKYFIAYSPIAKSNWDLLVAQERNELYAPVYRQIFNVGSSIVILIAGGMTSIVLILRNLTGRMQNEIEERLKVTVALRKERDFTKTLFEANPAFFVALDSKGKVILMNPAILNALEYTLDEVIGKDYLSTFVPPEDRKLVTTTFREVIKEKKSSHQENHLCKKSGSKILVEWHGRAIVNPETNQEQVFFGVGTDITERKRVEEEIRLLQRITQAVLYAEDFDSALELALFMLCDASGWALGEAWIPNDEETQLECSPVWDSPHSSLKPFREVSEKISFAKNVGLPGRVFASQKSEWIEDVSSESEKIFLRAQIAGECGLKAGLGVPIISQQKVLAVLVFFMFTAQAEDQRLVKVVSSVAMQLGSVFERKQAEEKYRRLFENAIEGIFQITPEGRWLSINPAFAKILGYSSPEDVKSKLTNLTEQLYVEPNCYAEFQRLMKEVGIVSSFEAQFYRQDGKLIWVLMNGRAVYNYQGKMSYYEGSIIEISDRKEKEEQLRYHASHDALTQLWSRSFFLEQVEQAILRLQQQLDNRFAVLFLDVDGFKLVNDSLGHIIGDQLLVAIAQRLRQCLRGNDTLARLGGDEFTILVDKLQSIDDAVAIAKRIKQAFQPPFAIANHEIYSGVSIGIVESNPDYQKPQELLRDADTAMYRAKRQGKGGYAIFDATMRIEAIERLELETDLRRALKNNELEVYYQPIVSISTGKIKGFEALLRWDHPQRGKISPAQFIPVAEEAGLISSIGEWVLREACRQNSLWNQQFYHYGSNGNGKSAALKMSVNLSVQQFTNDLSQIVADILAETGVDGRDVKLEITETALMVDPNSAIAILRKLKEQNILICLDDFGTGYCSLSYLHSLPIDILKIDRSFVSRMNNNGEIVRTIVNLAHNLNLDVIAEGVESVEQLQQLQVLNCKYAQGYFFSKPLNKEAATVLLAQQQMSEARASN
ncbi:MAG: EAL domain-containing protein [Oscillatoria sp. PMC 1068.18]|nr:EAL domain-containing protein [Oscillatoria sp. PMC 1076.18]MEC4987778.1 EAL domain-containing protein [Oscillatoria sp. PMC 1068.18]